MLTMVFFKALSDYGIYYGIIGSIALTLGAQQEKLLIAMAVNSVAITLSYLLREKKALRFLPFPITLASVFISGSSLTDCFINTFAALYSFYIMAKKIYEPERDEEVKLFGFTWKAVLPIILFGFLLEKKELLLSFTIPVCTLSLMCLIVLMRSLRHDVEVYSTPAYQITNVAAVAAAGAGVWLMSTKTFLSACGEVIKAAYSVIIRPILELAVYLVTLFVWFLQWLFSFISLKEVEEQAEEEIEIESAAEILGVETVEPPEMGDLLKTLFTVLGIAAAAVAIILLFRYLSRRSGRDSGGGWTTVSETAQEDKKQRDTRDVGNVQSVRHTYRKFLKRYISGGRKLERSDTSFDVNHMICSDYKGIDAESSELRGIYIRARYGGEASKQDAQRAKELYYEIKRKTE